MEDHQKTEIKRKIRELEEQIYDCKSYLASNLCVTCEQMSKNICRYELEIEQLKKILD